ncbi:molybdenum cofactor biosynthesis protein B [Mycobacteroides abscessus subsp. abscessus]|nr:molybdenum cofactor biosynthesis protein B [Mycobacteroides abscessus subsp. abscessus]
MDFEDTRYNRQELMPSIGQQGQARLAGARVVVIGAGGVKSPLLLYLAAAGVGNIRVIDFDNVELSNLNRQILFDTQSIGQNKAAAAEQRLLNLNPEIQVEAIDERIGPENIARVCGGYDIVIEGGDSTRGREVVNRYCVESGQVMVHASAQYGYGYVLTTLPGRTACFSCVFPDLPQGHGGSVPVYGISTGIAGCLGANEVLKILLNKGRLATNGILTFSTFQNDFQFVPSPRRVDCSVCGDGR